MAGNPDIGGGKLIPGRSVFASMIHTLKSARIEHAMGGISGGVVSTLVLHPLDLIKIRFAGKNFIMAFIALLATFLTCVCSTVDDGKAANRPSYSNIRHAFKSIYIQEGFRGFYKGVTPNVIGGGVSWGLYFLL